MWVTDAKMDEMLGIVIKGKSWRDSGNIPHRPCCVTQKDDKDHREWGCPIETQEWTEDETKQLDIKTVGEADGEDAIKIDEVFNEGSATASTDVDDPKEGSTGLALWKSKVTEFTENKKDIHQNYVEMSRDTSEILSKMQNDNNKYCKEIIKDVQKHKEKVFDPTYSSYNSIYIYI